MSGSYKGPLNPHVPIPDGESRIVIYNYVPSLPLGLIGAILFGIVTLGHAWLWWRGGAKRAQRIGRGRGVRWFEGLWVVGCAMEVVGYVFRIRSHYNPYVVNSFIIQYFLIVVAPVLFSAALYLSLQYAINLNPANLQLSPVKRFFVKIFIAFDVVSTGIQVAGAALIGVAESRQARGQKSPLTSSQANDILLAGLAIQCASFLVFLVILAFIIIRIRKTGLSSATVHEKRIASTSSPSSTTLEAGPPVIHHGHTYTKTFLLTLYGTSLLIFGRTLFRLAETAEGVWGTASSNEWLFGVFEFAPVILSALIWLARPLEREMERMT